MTARRVTPTAARYAMHYALSACRYSGYGVTAPPACMHACAGAGVCAHVCEWICRNCETQVTTTGYGVMRCVTSPVPRNVRPPRLPRSRAFSFFFPFFESEEKRGMNRWVEVDQWSAGDAASPGCEGWGVMGCRDKCTPPIGSSRDPNRAGNSAPAAPLVAGVSDCLTVGLTFQLYFTFSMAYGIRQATQSVRIEPYTNQPTRLMTPKTSTRTHKDVTLVFRPPAGGPTYFVKSIGRDGSIGVTLSHEKARRFTAWAAHGAIQDLSAAIGPFITATKV